MPANLQRKVSAVHPSFLSLIVRAAGPLAPVRLVWLQQGAASCRASFFCLGLASTLAGLGVLSTLVGKAYGQIGSGLPIAVSLIAILMGANLLELLPLQLPSLDIDTRSVNVPPLAQVGLWLKGNVRSLGIWSFQTIISCHAHAWRHRLTSVG